MMRKNLSLKQVVLLPFCLKSNQLKHPLSLNIISFVLVLCFLLAFYYLIPAYHKLFSLIILLPIFYMIEVIVSYLFYKFDFK